MVSAGTVYRMLLMETDLKVLAKLHLMDETPYPNSILIVGCRLPSERL